MATKAVTITPWQNGRGATAVWAALANGDDGSPIDWTRYADRFVQFSGTWGAAGSVQLEGSVDGTNWAILNDLQGSAITKTAAGAEGVAEVPVYVRPKVTAGDGTTAIVCKLSLRSTP